MNRRRFLRTAAVVAPVVVLDPQLLWRASKRTDREIRQFVRELRHALRRMLRETDDDVVAGGWPIGVGLEAEEVTTDNVILAPALRQPGFYTSPTFSIPPSITMLRLFANLALSDKLAVGEAMDLDVLHASDGVTFTPLVGFGWTSYGPAGYHDHDRAGNPIDNPDPSVAFSPQNYLNDTFELRLSLPQPLTLGATVEITVG